MRDARSAVWLVPALTLSFALSSPRAFAQGRVVRGQLVGAWALVRADNVLPNGSRVHLYGDHPAGILMFDATGRYSLQILSAERPRFAANDKSKGTAEEYRAAVQGSNSHFGRYAITADGAILFQIDHASFPNWEGTEQRRAFSLVGDELTYTVPTPTSGAGVGEVVWRRVQ